MLTKFSEKTVTGWINAKENPLPAYQINEKEYRIKPDEFWAWLEYQRTNKKGRVKKLTMIN